jgi:hypothetical protein
MLKMLCVKRGYDDAHGAVTELLKPLPTDRQSELISPSLTLLRHVLPPHMCCLDDIRIHQHESLWKSTCRMVCPRGSSLMLMSDETGADKARVSLSVFDTSASVARKDTEL